MRLRHKLLMLAHFAHTRWWLRRLSPAALARRQQRQLRALLQRLSQAPAFAGPLQNLATTTSTDRHPLADLMQLPTMDKAQLMNHFAAYNCAGIGLPEARAVALAAEQSRDFSPRLGDYSVGLSSGTSGSPAVFLVSPSEQARWAGILLAKTLPAALLQQLLCFWRAPLRIAFFLRANSNLYQTLNSRRIDFRFYDLTQPLAAQNDALNQFQPQVLVAPASVLQQLCQWQQRGELALAPSHLVNVAEVLEDPVRALINRSFPAACLQQIYQATEGFLGYSCEAGRLHLNETHLVIERQWLDPQQLRFTPVITDFSRTTQTIVRYQLNDLLQADPEACPCGRAEAVIARVEGRSDEILWARQLQTSQWQALFPDTLRQHLLAFAPALSDYRIIQDRSGWQIQLCDAGLQHWPALHRHLLNLFERLQLRPPHLRPAPWQPGRAGDKLRRLIMVARHE